jgi:5-hydroxyisourate hydrolase
MSGITTHVLDTSLGRPAAGVRIELENVGDAKGAVLKFEAQTDADGRMRQELPWSVERGVYRLRFDTGAYFRERGVEAFYPEVTVTFEVRDATQHYHVPLLISPYGYSTYRGS